MTILQHNVVKENSLLNTLPITSAVMRSKTSRVMRKLTLTGLLQKSSNIGAYRLDLVMPSSALVDTYSHFDLGKRLIGG
ncbi:MAG: penicillin-binding transpeptidase domain-containing protein [Candidatus Malihini olakiniferum]